MFLRKSPEVYITRLRSKKEWSFLKLMQSKHPKNLTKVSKNSPSSIGGRLIAEKEDRTLVLQCEVWYTIISRKDRKD